MAAPRTVLVTGSSSGIGRATVERFALRGWNVVATLRTPSAVPALAELPNTLVAPLDVTDPASIDAAFEAATERFGGVDAVVNNAGYGLVGPFETFTAGQVERQLHTNVTGVMNVCRAAIPHMRERGGGTIVNVASMGGRITFPYYSVYHASKWAVEGFTESLQHELREFGIRVRIVEPGPVATHFYGGSMDTPATDAGPYERLYEPAHQRMVASGANGEPPERAARVIVRAAGSRSWRLRYPSGRVAWMLLSLRRVLPDAAFNGLMRRSILR